MVYKFRGLTKKGVWVYGFFWKAPDGTCYIKQNGEDFVVEENTVGLFSGRKDKNGVEIYCGDIIETDKKVKCEVYWNNDHSRYQVRYVNVWKLRKSAKGEEFNYYLYKSLKWAVSRGVVIGNIYSNPELLNN